MIIEVKNEEDTKNFGFKLGTKLSGGEVIELVGDIGAGKTTLVKGIAQGLGVNDNVQSPSFTVSRVYKARNDLKLAHYDFYRLDDAGIMAHELAETMHDPKAITVIEWANTVSNILPTQKISIKIIATAETTRRLTVTGINL